MLVLFLVAFEDVQRDDESASGNGGGSVGREAYVVEGKFGQGERHIFDHLVLLQVEQAKEAVEGHNWSRNDQIEPEDCQHFLLLLKQLGLSDHVLLLLGEAQDHVHEVRGKTLVHFCCQKHAAYGKFAGFLEWEVPVADGSEVAVEDANRHEDCLVSVLRAVTQLEHLLHGIRSFMLSDEGRLSRKLPETGIIGKFTALLNLQLNFEPVVRKRVKIVTDLEGFLLAPDAEVAGLAVLGVVLVTVLMEAGGVAVHERHLSSNIAFIYLR